MSLGGPDRPWREAGEELCRRTRAAQGLPPKITDPAAIARTVALLRTPDKLDTPGIHARAAAARRRMDQHPVDVRAEQGTPPMVVPPSPRLGEGLPGRQIGEDTTGPQVVEGGSGMPDRGIQSGGGGEELAA